MFITPFWEIDWIRTHYKTKLVDTKKSELNWLKKIGLVYLSVSKYKPNFRFNHSKLLSTKQISMRLNPQKGNLLKTLLLKINFQAYASYRFEFKFSVGTMNANGFGLWFRCEKSARIFRQRNQDKYIKSLSFSVHKQQWIIPIVV